MEFLFQLCIYQRYRSAIEIFVGQEKCNKVNITGQDVKCMHLNLTRRCSYFVSRDILQSIILQHSEFQKLSCRSPIEQRFWQFFSGVVCSHLDYVRYGRIEITQKFNPPLSETLETQTSYFLHSNNNNNPLTSSQQASPYRLSEFFFHFLCQIISSGLVMFDSWPRCSYALCHIRIITF